MNETRWARVQALFEEALARPVAEREAFLDAACGDDAGLREEVGSLLTAHFRTRAEPDLQTAWLRPLAASRRRPLAAGRRVAGRYRIEGVLGRGGMGEVYEAWDEALSIRVALKTLLVAGASREALQRLKLESLLARAVWHPNVCRVYELSRHGRGRNEVWFLSMELLAGETLAERLARVGRVPPETALAWAAEMAAGLAAAHRAGVVHRDFKPGNVILTEREGREQAVVTDFGTAASLAAADGTGAGPATHGTPAYMAPEQLAGEPIGPAADVYAFGLVLHEMLTGGLPAPGADSAGLDPNWEQAIRRCLEPDPARRYRGPAEAVAAISGVAGIAEEGPRTVVPSPGSLPAELDRFVGRETELEELATRLGRGARLVTIVGAGGMGKSRLAIRHGGSEANAWPGGAWFCDLTQARDARGVAAAVARTLSLTLGRDDPVGQVGLALNGRGRCLVILDNFEQVASHARATVGAWLEAAPEARFVVTSRQRLALEGEEPLALEPLPAEAGFELFAARARALRPGLELDDEEIQAARAIVDLVDGMPLAIELAAARMQVMSASEILARMRSRFRLLAGGRSPHHETLEGAIDGSWELLRPWEKSAWAQCAVFEGGFTLAAAEAVLDLSRWKRAPWVVDVLQSLVDKSLLRTRLAARDGARPEIRFDWYVSLHEYARLKLQRMRPARGGDGVGPMRAAEERHGRWYGLLGTPEAIEALDLRGGVARRRQLERELANLFAACRRALARGDGSLAVPAYRALAEVLAIRGPWATTTELGREILQVVEVEARERAQLLWAIGRAERLSANMDEAFARSEEALALARQAGDRRLESLLIGWLGVLHHDRGDRAASRAHYEQALALHREFGDRHPEAVAVGNLGILHHIEGALPQAREHYEMALAIHREVGGRTYEGIVLGFLASLLRAQGKFDEARAANESALAIHREVGNRSREGQILGNLGNLQLEQGRHEEAAEHYEAAVAIAREVGDRRNEALFLANLGNLYVEQGRFERAGECFGTAVAIHEVVGTPLQEASARGALGRLLGRQGRASEARQSLVAAEEVLRRVEGGHELAKMLCFRAELEFAENHPADGQRALNEAESLAAGLGPETEIGKLLGALRQRFGLTSRT